MLRAQTSHGMIATFRAGWHFGLAVLPAAVTAVLPKCPVCLMTMLSVIGLGSVITPTWLLPLSFVFLLITIAIFLTRARRQRAFGPLALGLLAAILVISGRFYVDSKMMTYFGIGTLIGASIWSSWPKKRDLACGC